MRVARREGAIDAIAVRAAAATVMTAMSPSYTVAINAPIGTDARPSQRTERDPYAAVADSTGRMTAFAISGCDIDES